MQTDKDFFSPEYIRHILVKLRPWKGLVLISRLVGSDLPLSIDLGVIRKDRFYGRWAGALRGTL